MGLCFWMSELLDKAIAGIDAANGRDPNFVMAERQSRPKELVYSEHMTRWLFRLEKNPSEALQIAARAQHLCRWEIPRSTYPAGRIGYLQWRTALYAHHAMLAAEILREAGFDEAAIGKVQRLLRKQGIKNDAEMQMLEDVACLVFLETELEDFQQRQEDEKVIEILGKTWKKMSERGHAAAIELLPKLPGRVRALVRRAVSG